MPGGTGRKYTAEQIEKQAKSELASQRSYARGMIRKNRSKSGRGPLSKRERATYQKVAARSDKVLGAPEKQSMGYGEAAKDLSSKGTALLSALSNMPSKLKKNLGSVEKKSRGGY